MPFLTFAEASWTTKTATFVATIEDKDLKGMRSLALNGENDKLTCVLYCEDFLNFIDGTILNIDTEEKFTDSYKKSHGNTFMYTFLDIYLNKTPFTPANDDINIVLSRRPKSSYAKIVVSFEYFDFSETSMSSSIISEGNSIMIFLCITITALVVAYTVKKRAF